jgi:hypothetical protein
MMIISEPILLNRQWIALHSEQLTAGLLHRELFPVKKCEGTCLFLIISEKTLADFLAVRLRSGSLKST